MFEPDEVEPLAHWNFPDCPSCVNRFKKRTCAECGAGEFFVEVDAPGVDDFFRR